ncbi:Crp/Fnr family transcriptional regulator [Nitratireductor sp. XY-223]|uniref:Crp/Fnr family transcriptional regulator n=1 Tax=Nitratireductor sp. XY-223 TaxID=2561926 RepID=UPI00145B4141|nr:Crp/Fnr family transcriptional regulator [Nitratireductor sp. XY-223]
MKSGARNLLYLVDLLADLDIGQLNEIGETCEWIRVSKGQEVISQNQLTTDVYFIVEGSVAAKGYSVDGKEVTYAEISAGQVFGEFSAIDERPRSAAVEALEDSYLARMDSTQFRALIADYPVIGLKLAELLVRKNRSLTDRMFEYSTMAVHQRICTELLRMVDSSDAEDKHLIEPAPSHYQIATKLSTHREAVSKELARLSKLGIVNSGRRKIEVLDVERLRQLAQSGIY